MALNKLKIMTVTDSLIKDLNLQECSICQEELEVGNNIAEMPGCGHCFHNECVLKWFNLVCSQLQIYDLNSLFFVLVNTLF